MHRGRSQEGSLRSTQTEHSVQAALEPEAKADRAHSLFHQLDCRAPASRRLDPL
jgi:hypothetical protein